MKREIHIISIALCLFGGLGCIQQIDDQINKVDQQAEVAWQVLHGVLGDGTVAFEQTEASRDSLQHEKVNRRIKDALNAHTKDGRLYASTQPDDGTLVAMRTQDIETIMSQRDELILQTVQQHQTNIKAISLLRDAISKYDAMITMLGDKKADWLEKRKSAAAAINSAIQALEGAGGAAAIFVPLLF